MVTLKQLFMTAVSALLLATTSAFGEECTAVTAVADEPGDFYGSYDPVCEGFQFCILSQLEGDIAGEWWFFSTYTKNKGNKIDKDYQLDDPFETGLPFWLSYAVSRIETGNGDIYTSSHAIYDDDSTVFTEVNIVTGGTGNYIGATGNLLGYVDPREPPNTDTYHDGPIYIIGKICTP